MQTDWLHSSSSQKISCPNASWAYFFFAILCLLTRSIYFLIATMTMFLHQELKALRWGWGQAWEIHNSPKPQTKQVFHWKSYPQVSTFPLSCLFMTGFYQVPSSRRCHCYWVWWLWQENSPHHSQKKEKESVLISAALWNKRWTALRKCAQSHWECLNSRSKIRSSHPIEGCCKHRHETEKC